MNHDMAAVLDEFMGDAYAGNLADERDLRRAVAEVLNAWSMCEDGSSPVEGDGQAAALEIQVAAVEQFAAETEASSIPLLGTEAETLIAAGGTFMKFGQGGAGKTTAELDLSFHMAAGIPWLGLPVRERVRGLILEGEGPRGKLRTKLASKLKAWRGPSVAGWLHVIESPWATLSLADPEHRAGIAAAIAETRADVLYAGPVAALGLEGGGTPAEVRQFVGHLEHVRELVGRPVAFVLIAHTNKGGQVSGAWDGATDTLAHLMAMGNGSTRLHWQKCRWAGSLHGATWNLHWRDGETFELDEKPAVTIDTIEADLLAAVTENPGASWSKTRERITGNDKDKARVRDRLIADGAIVNTATRDNYFTLYPADDTPTRTTPDSRASDGTGCRSAYKAGIRGNQPRIPRGEKNSERGSWPRRVLKKVLMRPRLCRTSLGVVRPRRLRPRPRPPLEGGDEGRRRSPRPGRSRDEVGTRWDEVDRRSRGNA